MKWTPWQVIALVSIVIIGSVTPLFALASSVDADEIYKSAVGAVSAGILASGFALIKKIAGR